MADNTKPIPPVPNKSDLLEPIAGTDPKKFSRKMSVVWVRWMIQLRDKINLINATIASLSGFSGSGFISADGTGSVNGRTIQGTTGRISITNGDGVAADPVVDLVDTLVTPGSFTNTNLTVDAAGRITAASNGSAAGSPLTTKGDLFGFDTADARVPVGTDGYVLTADSTAALGVSYKPAGTPTLPVTTKGDILGYSTAPARVPVGTDGQILRADSSQSTGLSWGNLFPGTIPLIAAFSTFGTGITAADATGRMRLSVTQGTVLRGISQAGIATPYTIDVTFGFMSAPTASDSVWAGIGVSDGTKFRTFYCGAFGASTSNDSLRFAVDSWNSSTSFSATVRNSGLLFNPSNAYLRITDDDTTRKFYASPNGLDFVLVYSEATNTFVTPSNFAIVCYNNSQNSYTANISITNWLVTNSVLGDAA